jgi:hypothetical protein
VRIHWTPVSWPRPHRRPARQFIGEQLIAASVTLRKARAVAQVDITLRQRENGEDALLAHIDDRRHAVDVLGTLIDD